jgi:O-succinylbenzoate synthase
MSHHLRLWEIEVPFRHPLRTAHGEFAMRHSVIVALDIDGVTGWAEAPGFPSGRFGTAADAFDDLADPTGWANGVPNVPIAAAAYQGARTDAAARHAGLPLHAYLGSRAEPIVARHPIGVTDPTNAIRETTWLQTHGIIAVKVKVEPGSDATPIRALRQAMPLLDIGVDANGSYTDPDDPGLAALDDLDVTFIEQPFPADALAASAALRARSRMAVCLDESVPTVAAVRVALDAGAADQIAVKLNRVGLAALRDILSMCLPAGIGVQLGGTFDTAVGRRHLLAASGLPGIVDAAVGPPSAYLATELGSYPSLIDGAVTPDDTPGIGLDVDTDLLDDIALRTGESEVIPD